MLDAYKAQYGADPASNYALYGVQALQVILAAIEKSDGTRKGVRDQVFSGSGITIPAATAALGKDITIAPATGDVNAIDISVEIVSALATPAATGEKYEEKFLEAVAVK